MEVSNSDLELINNIVRDLAPSFVFGYFGVEDLEQEGRLFGLDALSRYNPEKGASLKTFLTTHIKNRFLTFRRDKYIRTAPKNLSPEKLEIWLKKHSVKRNLMDAMDIDDERNSDAFANHDEDVASSLLNKELFKIVDRELPVEYRADYRCIVEDVKIPKARREKVLEILRNIINEHFSPRKEEG